MPFTTSAPDLPPLPPLPPTSLDNLSASLRSFIGNVESSLHVPPPAPPQLPPLSADSSSTAGLPELPPLGVNSLRSSGNSIQAASNYGAAAGGSAGVSGVSVSGSDQASGEGERGIEGGDDDASWCRSKASAHNVVPRKSWGNLPSGPLRDEWHERKCNKHLLMNRQRERGGDGGSGGSGGSGASSGRSGRSGSSSSSSLSSSSTLTSASTVSAFSNPNAAPSTATAAKAPVDPDEAWCRETVWTYDVRPGSTWGKLNSQGQGDGDCYLIISVFELAC